MKNILVLGANGFLGSHFCKKLSKKKYKIYPVVRYTSNLDRFVSLNNFKKINILKYKDISETNKIIKFIKNYNIKIIINFAAHGVLFKKKQKSFKTFNKTNFLDVKKLIKECAGLNIERYVHIGTISEFGKQKNKIYEGLKEKAYDNYSLSKLNFTHYLKFNHNKKEVPYTLLRLFPVYGPLENNKKLFPYIIKSLSKNSEVNLTSGNQIRNYTYVDDMNIAIIKCLETKKTINKSLIIGNEKSYTLKKIVNKILEVMNKEKSLIKWNNIKRKDQNINFIPLLKKTKNLIKWKSKISLEVGIKKMLKFR